MGFTLAPQADAAGYRLLGFDTIGSTNTEALDQARSGDLGPLWVTALQQTAGKGRRGRTWVNPRGNLAASLLLTVTAPPAVTATLGFVAGLSIHQALQLCAPALSAEAGGAGRLKLKWPNDVLVDGAKLVGILLESETLPDGRRIVVVGIGVNVVAAPEGVPYAATSLAALGIRTSAETLFEALSACWLEYERLWDEGRGMGAIRRLWLERAAGVGDKVAVQLGDDIVYGYFETIDDAGQLVVKREDGSYATVAAGDVYFGDAATAKGA